jgi:hypothetical protein
LEADIDVLNRDGKFEELMTKKKEEEKENTVTESLQCSPTHGHYRYFAYLVFFLIDVSFAFNSNQGELAMELPSTGFDKQSNGDRRRTIA